MTGWNKKFGASLVFLFALLLGFSAIIRYFFMDPVETNAVLIREGLKMYDMHFRPWNVLLYIHIFTAAIVVVIGPFQFIKKLRDRNIRLHRYIGRLYAALILISGLAGIYLSVYAYGGLLAKLGFFCLDIAWLYTTFKAITHIRNRRIKLHEQWMARSYAVTFAAVTFRIWSAVIGYSLDNFKVGYIVAVWLCWTLNLLFVEFWVRKKTPTRLITGKTENL